MNALNLLGHLEVIIVYVSKFGSVLSDVRSEVSWMSTLAGIWWTFTGRTCMISSIPRCRGRLRVSLAPGQPSRSSCDEGSVVAAEGSFEAAQESLV